MSYPNRTMCAVLDEMRNCYKSRNFAGLLGLVEEAQTMANRMEASLWDQREIKDLRNEIKKLEKKKQELEDQTTVSEK